MRRGEQRGWRGCASAVTMSQRSRRGWCDWLRRLLLSRSMLARITAGLLSLSGNLPVRGAQDHTAHVQISAENRLSADDPRWRDLVTAFAKQPDTLAEFEERRFFPFRKEPVALKGEVRVSRARGLSLHYTVPEQRVVILDEKGVLVRDAMGQQAPPDRRAEAGNRALWHVLRMDFPALEKEFEVFGWREGVAWSLVLVPRDSALRRAIGNIHVTGEGVVVRTVELRRSEKQHIDIAMRIVRSPAEFSADDLKRYFR